MNRLWERCCWGDQAVAEPLVFRTDSFFALLGTLVKEATTGIWCARVGLTLHFANMPSWSCAWWTKDSQSPPQVHTDCTLSMSWPTVQNPNFFLVYGCDCSNLSLVWNERLICNNEVVEKIEQVRAGERTVFSFFIAKCLKARREGLKKAFEFTSTKYLPVSLRFE